MLLLDSRLSKSYRFFVVGAIAAAILAFLLLLDLILHPLEPNLYGLPYWHRWLFGFPVPLVNIVIGFLCIRRARGNVLGPLLVLYGSGIAAEGMRFSFPIEFIPLFLIFGGAFVWIGYFYCVLLFPTGSFFPPRWRIFPIAVLICLSIFMVLWLLGAPSFALGANSRTVMNVYYQPAIAALLEAITKPTVSLTVPLFILYLPASLILRYRAAEPKVKQQMKVMFWGVLLQALVIITSNILQAVKIEIRILNSLSTLIVFLLPPFAVGIAILRHRLYDIDIIIRRTLIYSVLSGLLALVFFGGVTLTQAVFRSASGETSDLAIVVSTLGIAALFTPLRRRVQNTIDRRFYRRKYDAEQTLAQFAALAKDEVDVEKLKVAVVGAVQETMHPTSVGLWIRRPEKRNSVT
jgi:hypothetical protein